jgi:hypothetical protein
MSYKKTDTSILSTLFQQLCKEVPSRISRKSDKGLVTNTRSYTERRTYSLSKVFFLDSQRKYNNLYFMTYKKTLKRSLERSAVSKMH